MISREIAMQKAEGSSPFSRFPKSLHIVGFFCRWPPTHDRCENIGHGRCLDHRRLPVRRRALCPQRATSRRRLLPLHPLPTPNRDGSIGASANRRSHAAILARRGSAEGLATSRRRPREAFLQRVWLTFVQSQPRGPYASERAHGRLR